MLNKGMGRYHHFTENASENEEKENLINKYMTDIKAQMEAEAWGISPLFNDDS